MEAHTDLNYTAHLTRKVFVFHINIKLNQILILNINIKLKYYILILNVLKNTALKLKQLYLVRIVLQSFSCHHQESLNVALFYFFRFIFCKL